MSDHNIDQNIKGSGNIFTGAGNIVINNPPYVSLVETQVRARLQVLLDRVKTFWVEGVLEKSIHEAILLDLGKKVQDVVDHPWSKVLELPGVPSQVLPPNTKIIDVFRQANHALLILGEPGSGKTITLIELVRDLILQLEEDKTFVQPIPVIFHLSSWIDKRQPLIDWLM